VFRNIAEELGWVLPERFPKPPTSELEASPRSPDRPIGERERTALLNIIGGLLGLLLDKAPSGKKYSVFESQEAVVSALLAHHESKPGMSKSNLEHKFPEAKRSSGAG